MHPIHLMPKPAGSACNLDCTYCYYLEKQKLYAASGRQEMSDELLEKYIHDYIATQPTDNVLFTWHGGEPLVRPMSFYERALRLQEKHAQGKTIENALQTNGNSTHTKLVQLPKRQQLSRWHIHRWNARNARPLSNIKIGTWHLATSDARSGASATLWCGLECDGCGE